MLLCCTKCRNTIVLNNLDRSGPRFNVAHVVSTLDIEVTGETPFSSPRITDDPVRNEGSGSSGAVSDDDDGVIDVGNGKIDTGRIAENSASVMPERNEELNCISNSFSINNF